MSTTTLTLAARRELTAVRVAADIRYGRHAATVDGLTARLLKRGYAAEHLGSVRSGLIRGHVATARRKPVVTQVKPVAAPKVKVHSTSVTAVGDKFLAVCKCGDPIQARPTGEAYAKGMATRHLNATSGAL